MPRRTEKDFLLGLYVKVTDKMPAFAKFCGYNTLEILDRSFVISDEKIADYYREAKETVERIHGEGLKAYVILLTNESRKLNVENIDKNLKKNEYEALFNPVKEPREYEQRLRDQREALRKGFASADGLEIFAGDPGGCEGEGCGVDQYLRFPCAFTRMVRELGTPAEVTLNTWAIANWGVSLGVALNFWDGETELSREVIASNLSFADAVTLPGHNLYRFLVRQLYTKTGREVPNWPDRAAIESIRAKTKRVYLWPHFIVDDDPARALTYQKVHFEVRYLKELAQKVRDLGVDGAFVNAYNPEVQMGNIYAYGQLTKNPQKPERAILKDYAGLIVQPGSVDELTEVLVFMENHSWWGSQMPPPYRLMPLPCAITNYGQALGALNKVLRLTKSPAPLLMNPKDYLAEVRSTLLFMKENYPR